MAQHLLKDVTDSIRLRPLSHKRGPDSVRPVEEPTGSGPRVEQSEHVSLMHAVAQLSASSCALEVVLPCLGEGDSKVRRGFHRDPGAWASADVRKNPEGKYDCWSRF